MTITIGSGATRRDLSDQDAIKLTSGRDFWSSESVAGIPAIRMSDGPHGLRYQAQASDHLGINEAVPATAFPTASASASSWEPGLLAKMGAAIAEEARALNVDVVLGPGVNIKRNPLGGRNFEFFSEDPLLTGALAAAWIAGLQSKGVGASLKHFAGNSQETDRLRSDSLIDATALHELYLEAFRLAVTQSQPETVMIAYNLLNGTYMSDHEYLLNTVLRGQWGFKGAVVTDWGALNDKVASLNAGTDLEMPSSGHLFDQSALAALKTGRLDRARLTRAVANIAAIADRKRPAFTGDRAALLQKHVALAQQIEEHAAVLMKNDGALPLRPGRKLAVIGALAAQTRIQGAGSSHITTPQSMSILAGLKAAGHAVTYAPGYPLDGAADAALVAEAVAKAHAAEDVVVVLGLPATAEAEGTDRTSLALPKAQVALLHTVAAANPNVVVLLVAGSVVTTDWAKDAKAVLNLFLGGEAVGAAAERLLFGAVSPSGKLAETYPKRYADVPSSALYGRSPLSVPYAESLYVGYRYYDKAKMAVAYPFGFGLSYTTFRLSDARLAAAHLAKSDPALTVTVAVTNTGAVRGAEVVQAYVSEDDQDQLVPKQALAAFQKVWLAPGERQTVTLTLPQRAFCRWDEAHQQFTLAGGAWHVFVGTSSRDLSAALPLTVDAPAFRIAAPAWYRQPSGLPSVKAFTALSGLTPAPASAPKPGAFTRLSVPRDLAKYSLVARLVATAVIANMQKNDGTPKDSPEGQFLATIVWDTPLVRLAQQSGGSLKLWMVDALVALANHGKTAPRG
ncbi:glycoside hydrolase family 3 C-terminal domain-containing protein [Lacticaseibacillus jixianensis]|uniref:Glycoside hydrolase family 3 C-terminal domain-containing protein n=1 Tax=Lacticaseibacillus jixianensis TaxID=2486012 RepID=A0ABW4BBV2_9LACO|nr:glycoside hydrolase family 3 C-terminal domain-containing protein [Lacticaseibacillus jixianensis]